MMWRIIKIIWLVISSYISVFAAVMITFGFAAMLAFVKMYGYRIYAYSVQVLGTHFTQLMIGFIVIACGWMAHRFKRKNQVRYGAVEVIFGAVSAFAIASSLSPASRMLGPLTSLIGCAYVIARGMSNVSEGKLKRDAETR